MTTPSADAHDASAVSILDAGGYFTGPRISEDELAERAKWARDELWAYLAGVVAAGLPDKAAQSILVFADAMVDAARSAPAAGLDAAWAEAEAAVPEGYGFGVTKTVAVASGPYVATADYGPIEHGYAYGPTPAAALFALAAALTAEEVR